MDGAGSVTGEESPFFIRLVTLLLSHQQHLVLILKELLTLKGVMIYSAFIAPATQGIELE